jgi:hypothetical protein
MINENFKRKKAMINKILAVGVLATFLLPTFCVLLAFVLSAAIADAGLLGAAPANSPMYFLIGVVIFVLEMIVLGSAKLSNTDAQHSAGSKVARG